MRCSYISLCMSGHFGDCKALLFLSMTRVSSAIASVQTMLCDSSLVIKSYFSAVNNDNHYDNDN